MTKPIRGYDEVKEGDYAVLTVSDTGMGIPAENREKIFEPFYTKKTMGRSGTGLGLAIVWGTVKDHNGYIDVQTEVGEGTTFTLYFPVTREELIAQQQKAPIERYMGKGESVLVVDDIAEQREMAATILRGLGYQVRSVFSGEEAVEYLKGNKADILVLDMIMAPGIDGLETYRRVLEINPKQKAILVSGFSETERVKEGPGDRGRSLCQEALYDRTDRRCHPGGTEQIAGCIYNGNLKNIFFIETLGYRHAMPFHVPRKKALTRPHVRRKLTFKSSMIQCPLNQGARYEARFFTFHENNPDHCRDVLCLFDLPDFLQENRG